MVLPLTNLFNKCPQKDLWLSSDYFIDWCVGWIYHHFKSQIFFHLKKERVRQQAIIIFRIRRCIIWAVFYAIKKRWICLPYLVPIVWPFWPFLGGIWGSSQLALARCPSPIFCSHFSTNVRGWRERKKKALIRQLLPSNFSRAKNLSACLYPDEPWDNFKKVSTNSIELSRMTSASFFNPFFVSRESSHLCKHYKLGTSNVKHLFQRWFEEVCWYYFRPFSHDWR